MMNDRFLIKMVTPLLGVLILPLVAVSFSHNLSLTTGALIYPEPITVENKYGAGSGAYGLFSNQFEWRVMANHRPLYASSSIEYASYLPNTEVEAFIKIFPSVLRVGFAVGSQYSYDCGYLGVGVGFSYFMQNFRVEANPYISTNTENVFAPYLELNQSTNFSEKWSLVLGYKMYLLKEYSEKADFTKDWLNYLLIQHGAYAHRFSVGLMYRL